MMDNVMGTDDIVNQPVPNTMNGNDFKKESRKKEIMINPENGRVTDSKNGPPKSQIKSRNGRPKSQKKFQKRTTTKISKPIKFHKVNDRMNHNLDDDFIPSKMTKFEI